MTTLKNRFSRPSIDPNEPNLVAGYDCMVRRGAIRNLASSGAGYDLVTRVGTPLVGQGGGVYAVDSATSYWQGPFVPSVDLSMEAEFTTAPTAARVPLWNGTTGGTGHVFSTLIAGTLQGTMNGFGVSSTTAYSLVGRGPFRADIWHDGVLQRLLINGSLADSDAVVPGVPAGLLRAGFHGNISLVKAHGIALGSDAAYRSSYVREFAKQILWQWTPHREFASIATGTTGGDDDWYSPVGGAGLSIVWRTDLSEPAGGHLALTADSGSMARIEFPFKRPVFGAVLIEYKIRNPAFGADGMIVGLAPTRGADPTLAGSNAYWVNQYNNGGGWWRTSLYLANGAQIDGADTAIANAVAGRRGKILLTHAVNGDWQVWGYLPGVGWYWSQAVGNNVAVLEEGFISLIPRGNYVERVSYLQGEMTPHELAV